MLMSICIPFQPNVTFWCWNEKCNSLKCVRGSWTLFWHKILKEGGKAHFVIAVCQSFHLSPVVSYFKVWVFWEGHKIWKKSLSYFWQERRVLCAQQLTFIIRYKNFTTCKYPKRMPIYVCYEWSLRMKVSMKICKGGRKLSWIWKEWPLL